MTVHPRGLSRGDESLVGGGGRGGKEGGRVVVRDILVVASVLCLASPTIVQVLCSRQPQRVSVSVSVSVSASASVTAALGSLAEPLFTAAPLVPHFFFGECAARRRTQLNSTPILLNVDALVRM